MEMCFDEAVYFLMSAKRSEVHNQAHGDISFCWAKDGEEIAHGYYNGSEGTVSIRSRWGHAQFAEEDAARLMGCGALISQQMELGKNMGMVEMLESA